MNESASASEPAQPGSGLSPDPTTAIPPAPAAVAGVPRQSVKQPRQPDRSPRGLILAWALFLLGSWLIALRIDSPSSTVRWMVYACVLGLMLLWPVIRLSQEQTDPNGAQPRGGLTPGYIWLDWFCLALVLQSVIWPLHLTAGWSFPRTWWLNGTLCAWSLLTGFITALGCRAQQVVGRCLAMAGCVLLLVGEPLLLALTGDWLTQLAGGPWVYRLTPLRLINLLLNDPHAFTPEREGVQVALVAGAALVGWIGLWLMSKPAAPADIPLRDAGAS